MPRVLSVGQCGLDHGILSRYLSEQFDAAVVGSGTEADAVLQLGQAEFDLILVNRKLDGGGADGVEIVRRLRENPGFDRIPVMLVSNYADAQSAAVAAGAERGFGKSQYADPELRVRLGIILDDPSDFR